MTDSLEESVVTVRKYLKRSRYAYRKAETLLLIKKYVRADLKRHVFRYEMKGTSFFLTKELEKQSIPRTYVPKDFYRYLDRQHRVFPSNTGISARDERSTNLMLKRFVRKNFLLPETKKKLYLLELATQRLERISSEIKKSKEVKVETNFVNKSAGLERISSSLFHEYPQQVARDFAISKIQKEKVVIEHNCQELAKEYTYLKFEHDLVVHSANVIARAYRCKRFHHAAKRFRNKFKLYLHHLSKLSNDCYKKLRVLWAKRAAALKIQSWWRGRTARIKYLARLNWLMFLAVVRIQRNFRASQFRKKLERKRKLKYFWLRKCEKLLAISMQGWRSFVKDRHRQRWLRKYAMQIRLELQLIRFQRVFRSWITHGKLLYANRVMQSLHPVLKSSFSMYHSNPTDQNFKILQNKILNQDLPAMAWKLEKWLRAGEDTFGRQKLKKHCKHDVYESFIQISPELLWKNNPYPLRGYDWIHLKQEIDFAYKSYETYLTDILNVFILYGRRQDRKECIAMLKSYIYLDLCNDIQSPIPAIQFPGIKMKADACKRGHKSSFFRWFSTELCPSCHAMLDNNIPKCLHCSLPRYAMGLNITCKRRKNRKKRILRCPPRGTSDIVDSNKLFLLHVDFAINVPERYSLHGDRDKRNVIWWWNRIISRTNHWIHILRNKYQVRTIAHLGQLSVESLVKMTCPLRAARKIKEWMTFLQRILVESDH